MARQKYDRSSKWLIEEQGVPLLHLAGVPNALSSQALQPEVVQPAQLPDGLLQVKLAGQKEPRLYLLEIATYPEKRVAQQMHDDIMLVRQARGFLPEALVVVLREKGTYRVPKSLAERSAGGWTTSNIGWEVLEVWMLTAEAILTGPDVGTVPLAPLAQFDGSPEVVLQRCRTRIDKEGGKHQATLLAVTQTLTRLRFDHPDWLSILGGKSVMIESPLFREVAGDMLLAARVEMLRAVLEERFASIPPTVEAGLLQIKEEDKLTKLARIAGVCLTMQAFETSLRAELPSPAPASTRGKRRKASE